MNLKKHLLSITEGIAVFLALFIFFQVFQDFLSLILFQERDLDRARALLNGQLILGGPELTGGGRLPGPFYYFLLALPVSLKLGWMGAWKFFTVALSGCLASLWIYFRNKLGRTSTLFFLILCLCFWPVQEAILGTMNSSWSIVISGLFLIGVFEIFSGEGRHKIWVLICFLLGLGIQLHYTVLTFFVGLLILAAIEKRKEILSGIFAFLLPLLPYLLFGQKQDINYGGKHSKSLITIFNSSLQLLSMGNHTKINMFGAVSGARFVMGALFLIAMLVLPFLSWRLKKTATQLLQKAWFVSGVLSAVTFVPAILPLMTSGSLRYALCFGISLFLFSGVSLSIIIGSGRFPFSKFVPAILFSVGTLILVLNEDMQYFGKTFLYALPLIVVLVGFSVKEMLTPVCAGVFLSAIVSANLSPTAFAQEGALSLTKGLEEAYRIVHSETGWTYDEAKERIFFVNVPYYTGVHLVYPEGVVRPSGTTVPDGYFFVDKMSKVDKLDEYVSPEIQQALSSGAIKLGKPMTVSQEQHLIPYFSDSHFQNIGDPYASEVEKEIQSQKKSGMVPEKRLFASFNVCPKDWSFCEILFVLESKNLKDPKGPVEVRILSEALAQPYRAISPDWNQSIKKPFVQFNCSGGKSRKITLADSIGNMVVSKDPKKISLRTGETLIAPFERTIIPDCGGKIEHIEIGYEFMIAMPTLYSWKLYPRQFHRFSL